MTSDELQAGLAQFTGTESYRTHPFNRSLLWTDGVDYFAEQAKAFWFLDCIAIGANGRPGPVPAVVPKMDHFGIVLLRVRDGSATVEVRDDYNEADETYGKTLYLESIGSTDCPEGDWKFYLIDDGEHAFLLLPSEY